MTALSIRTVNKSPVLLLLNGIEGSPFPTGSYYEIYDSQLKLQCSYFLFRSHYTIDHCGFLGRSGNQPLPLRQDPLKAWLGDCIRLCGNTSSLFPPMQSIYNAQHAQ